MPEFTFKHPFKTPSGKFVESVEINRLTRGDLTSAQRFAPDDPVRQEDFLLARMTGLNPDDMDALDMEDNGALLGLFREMAGLDGDAAASGRTAPAGPGDTA